jgi:hypothetical protein
MLAAASSVIDEDAGEDPPHADRPATAAAARTDAMTLRVMIIVGLPFFFGRPDVVRVAIRE